MTEFTLSVGMKHFFAPVLNVTEHGTMVTSISDGPFWKQNLIFPVLQMNSQYMRMKAFGREPALPSAAIHCAWMALFPLMLQWQGEVLLQNPSDSMATGFH